MCVLCNVLTSTHWADGDDTRRARVLRTALVSKVLSHYGLSVRDSAGALYLVSDRKGRTVVVEDIAKLWTASETLAHRPLDPLDPALCEHLASHD